MREGLGKVAHEPPRARIVSLGEKADVVANVEQALEDRSRLRVLALQRQIVGEPERAREKCPFARR